MVVANHPENGRFGQFTLDPRHWSICNCTIRAGTLMLSKQTMSSTRTLATTYLDNDMPNAFFSLSGVAFCLVSWKSSANWLNRLLTNLAISLLRSMKSDGVIHLCSRHSASIGRFLHETNANESSESKLNRQRVGREYTYEGVRLKICIRNLVVSWVASLYKYSNLYRT